MKIVVRRVVESAPGAGIGALTLYSFSSDNWQRPPAEVRALMSLFQSYLRMETSRCVAEGVRIRMIGRVQLAMGTLIILAMITARLS